MPPSESMTVVIDHDPSEVNRQLMDKHLAVLGPTSTSQSGTGSAHQEDDGGPAASKSVSFKVPSMNGEVVSFQASSLLGKYIAKAEAVSWLTSVNFFLESIATVDLLVLTL